MVHAPRKAFSTAQQKPPETGRVAHRPPEQEEIPSWLGSKMPTRHNHNLRASLYQSANSFHGARIDAGDIRIRLTADSKRFTGNLAELRARCSSLAK